MCFLNSCKKCCQRGCAPWQLPGQSATFTCTLVKQKWYNIACLSVCLGNVLHEFSNSLEAIKDWQKKIFLMILLSKNDESATAEHNAWEVLNSLYVLCLSLKKILVRPTAVLRWNWVKVPRLRITLGFPRHAYNVGVLWAHEFGRVTSGPFEA